MEARGVVVVLLLMMMIIVVTQLGCASATILLTNKSSHVVSISWNSSNPTQPCLLLAPGDQTGTLSPASYFFTNVHTERGDLSLDGFIYEIDDSAFHVGLVCVVREFLANHVHELVTADF